MTEKSTSTTMKLFLTIFTAIRLIFVLNLAVIPQALRHSINNPALQSVLFDPLYTAHHLREGQYLLNLKNGTFDAAYAGQVFHLPPLILAAFQPILSMQQSIYIQNVLFGIVVIVVDLAIALCLHDIARRMLILVDSRTEWEKELEGKMDSTIHPKRAWIFGIKFNDDPSTSKTTQSSENITEWQVVEKDGNITTEDSDNKNVDTPKKYPEPLLSIQDLPQLSALVYYCNPIPILAFCANESFSFQNICYLFVLLALRESMSWRNDVLLLMESRNNNSSKDAQPKSIGVCSGRINISGHASTAAFYLALASYMEIFPFVYIIPIGLLLSSGVKNEQDKKKAMLTCVGFLILWSTCLQLLSSILVGNDWPSVILKTYGYNSGFVDLSPNLGLQWYFFVQQFSRFRQYFVLMVAGLPYIFISPICIRLYRYPFVMATIFALLWVMFKPVLTVYDASIVLTLVILSPRSVVRMGNSSLVSLFALIVPIALFVVDYWMWLETGVGNANYMFFQCLAFNVFFSLICVDFISASLKRDKALRLTEKEIKQ